MTIKNATRVTTTGTYPVYGYGPDARIQWTVQLHRIGQQAAYFSVTGQVKTVRGRKVACGCLHDFSGVTEGKDAMLPELVRWHLTSVTTGPMHYEANSLYHFEQGNIDAFRSCCVFGAVEGDEMPTTLDGAREFLRNRFAALMVAFERDMVRWFGADVVEQG